MKKICFITTIPLTLKSFVIKTAMYLHENTDWDISFICDYDAAFEKDLPEYIHYFPVKMERGISISGFKAVREIKKIFDREKFDMIQYSTPNASLYASFAGRLSKVPVRLYCQWGMVYVGFSGLKRFVFKTMERFICRLSTWVEPDSHSNLKFSHSEKLYPENKGSVIWNGSACGVNLEKFDISKKNEYREEIRREIGCNNTDFIFGFVGRITRDKGVNELLWAFKKISQKYNDVYLMMVGPSENDLSVNEELYNWAKSSNRVIFTGYTNCVEKYISAMDIYILPSYREGFGMGVVEAEAMGVPVIVTNIPGPVDAMISGKTGEVVEKKDAEMLFEAMDTLYCDREKVESYGQYAKTYATESFEQTKLFSYILADRKRLLNEKQTVCQKNILFLTLLDFASIDEKNLYTDLLRQFIKNGHNVHVLSPIEKRNGGTTHIVEQGNCKILKFKIGNMQKTNLIEKGISMLLVEGWFKNAIKKYFNDVKYDVVLYATPPITLVDVVKYIKKRDGATSYLMLKDIFPQNAVDLGMFSKNGPIYTYFRFKEKKLYKLSDYIGCMSQANVDYIMKNNIIPAEKVGICPNSAELIDAAITDSKRNEIRNKLGVPSDAKVFVYGGNLGKPQCIEFIIECLEKCKDIKDVFFLIIGAGTDYNKLYDYYKTSGQTNLKVMSYLPKDEFDKAITACDVGMIFLDKRFTIPNFPSRLLSYMNAGLPVLAATDKNTDVGKIAVDNGFGWWMESTDSDEFKNLVETCKTADIKAMGKTAREYFKQNYTVEKVYDIITEAF